MFRKHEEAAAEKAAAKAIAKETISREINKVTGIPPGHKGFENGADLMTIPKTRLDTAGVVEESVIGLVESCFKLQNLWKTSGAKSACLCKNSRGSGGET